MATAQLTQLLGMLGAAGGSLQSIAKQPSADEPEAGSELTLTLRQFREAAAVLMQAPGKRTLAVGSAAS